MGEYQYKKAFESLRKHKKESYAIYSKEAPHEANEIGIERADPLTAINTVWQKYNAKAKEVELLQAKLLELQDEIKYLKEENKELMEQLLQS